MKWRDAYLIEMANKPTKQKKMQYEMRCSEDHQDLHNKDTNLIRGIETERANSMTKAYR